jgi:hypothetical protein
MQHRLQMGGRARALRTCPSRRPVISYAASVLGHVLDGTALMPGAHRRCALIYVVSLVVSNWWAIGGVRLDLLDSKLLQARIGMGTTRDTRGESVSRCCNPRGAAGRDDEGNDGIREHANGSCTRKGAWWQEMAAVEECKVPR